jgi:hypothetical protein
MHQNVLHASVTKATATKQHESIADWIITLSIDRGRLLLVFHGKPAISLPESYHALYAERRPKVDEAF